MSTTRKQAPTTIVDPIAYKLAIQVTQLDAQIKALEAEKDGLKEVLQETVVRYREDTEGQKKFVVACNLGEAVVTFVDGNRSSIQGDLLLEQGVKPEVVARATKTSSFTYIKVSATKDVQFN